MRYWSLWISYAIALLLVFAIHVLRYVRQEKHAGIPTRKAFIGLVLGTNLADGTTWVGSFGIAWTIGAVYIDRMSGISEWLAAAPLHPAIAFAIGGSMATVAPLGMRMLTNRIFPNG
jgi:hypothetical protein